MRFRSPALSGLLAACALAPSPARAEYPDWERVAGVEVIEVVTRDADGSPRETKVWFVRVDGEPYLRTSRSRWLDNLRRDPHLGLRIEGREYSACAEEVTGPDIVDRVDAASREKYGWQERLIHPFRMRRPDILRLRPCPSAGSGKVVPP